MRACVMRAYERMFFWIVCAGERLREEKKKKKEDKLK
jgi:hypothetical protein